MKQVLAQMGPNNVLFSLNMCVTQAPHAPHIFARLFSLPLFSDYRAPLSLKTLELSFRSIPLWMHRQAADMARVRLLSSIPSSFLFLLVSSSY